MAPLTLGLFPMVTHALRRRSCASVCKLKFHQFIRSSLAVRELEEISIGYPAWIRTKNNAFEKALRYQATEISLTG
jgi:hypothetical protein